jgi:hypothetical protein
MRMIAALLLGLALAACDASINSSDHESGAPPSGYTMEIRASSLDQTYIVVAPDGATVGARAAEGVSALMDSARARALFDDPPPQAETSELMSLRLPGFDMSIGGGGEGEDGEPGRVQISIGGDGQRVEVHADEGESASDADDRAFVRITGADEDAVREFIAEAEELSPEVKSQMLAGLGLSAAAETAP